MALSEITVGEVAELLRGAKSGGTQTCLLIGAGVSLSAGVGLADDFVDRIKRSYKIRYENLCKKIKGRLPNYHECMAALPTAQQVQLVRTDIDNAKINWAHIGIARLERAEVVGAILTPNFDPLASRACALLNQFPAIYDLAGLRDDGADHLNFDASYVKGSAIYHLHGQHTGFLLLNTEEKLEKQAKRVRPVLDAAMKGRPVIISGYSGENDPLVDEIAALAPFNHGLFWICHNETDPVSAVRRKLLSRDDCHIVRGMPADRFFTELANALDLDAPRLMHDPFGHVLEVLDGIAPFSTSEPSAQDDLLKQAREKLTKAAGSKPSRRKSLDIGQLMSRGQYQRAWDGFIDRVDTLTEDERDLLAWAGTMLGFDLGKQAEAKTGADADALYEAAGQKYMEVLSINPNKSETLFNWGLSLDNWGQKKDGEEADHLYISAIEKYRKALLIKSDDHEAWSNLGSVISNRARNKEGDEADMLYAEAVDKFEHALRIRPNELVPLLAWAITLSDHGTKKHGDIAENLFGEAVAKFEQAAKIAPDDPELLSGMAIVLARWARVKKGAAAGELFARADALYARLLEVRPDDSVALGNWALALAGWAQISSSKERKARFEDAERKLSRVVEIEADDHVTLNNYGTILVQWAATLRGQRALALYDRAADLFSRAEGIKPGYATYDLACLNALRGRASEAADLLRESNRLQVRFPGCAHILADRDFDAVRDTVEFEMAMVDIGCHAASEQTSEKAGTVASKVLKSGSTGEDSKTAAGSALTQRPAKKKK